MNFRRRPFLCTTLYRNPMQASNFGGTFDQLFLWIFLWNFYRTCVSTFSIPWCKKVKNDQKVKSRGGGGSCLKAHEKRGAQWPIGYGVGLRIKRSSVRIRPWPLRWVLGQGSLLPLSQGEAFTLASISYLAILVKYILAKKKKKKKKKKS